MSWLISFAWACSTCTKHKEDEKYKMKKKIAHSWNRFKYFLLSKQRRYHCAMRYTIFSHTRQWMIEQAHEIHLWMLRVYYISRQLYYICNVTSIVFNCFQGSPYHLAQLTSLWRHDFSPDTHSAIDRRSLFRNLFVHYLLNRSFTASLASVCGLFFRTN